MLTRLSLVLLLLASCTPDSPGQPAGSDLAGPGDTDMAQAGADMARPAETWRTVAPVPVPRTEVAAGVVRGKIYLLGGLGMGGGKDLVDIYDPQANTWSEGPKLPAQAPRHHLSVAVHRDRLFVLGGYVGDTFNGTQRSWMLDGTMWREVRQQPVSRGAAAAVTVGDRIYVMGGVAAGRPTGDTYYYEPDRDMWSARQASMNVAREHIAACAIGDLVVVSAGRASGRNVTPAEIYDTKRNMWMRIADQPTARSGLAAAAIGDVCYVFGGERLDGMQPSTFHENEGYNVKTMRWDTYPRMPTRRHGLAAVTLGPSIYVLAGGPEAGFTYSNVVEVFTP